MPDDKEDPIIPLRFDMLTMGEQASVWDQIPDTYEEWEILHGFYIRLDNGDISLVEDCREH